MNYRFVREARSLSTVSFVQIREGTHSRRVAKVEEYIDHHYTEEIRLATVASIAGMTPPHSAVFLSLRTGRCLSDCVIDMRLGTASACWSIRQNRSPRSAMNAGLIIFPTSTGSLRRKKRSLQRNSGEYYYKKKIIC